MSTEICTSDIRQTTFAAIVENSKDQNVNLSLVNGRDVDRWDTIISLCLSLDWSAVMCVIRA